MFYLSRKIGPTICAYGMEHVYVPNVPATPVAPYTIVDSETPVLIEVSPSAQDEEIVDVTVTGMPSDDTPKILKPSTDNLAQVKLDLKHISNIFTKNKILFLFSNNVFIFYYICCNIQGISYAQHVDVRNHKYINVFVTLHSMTNETHCILSFLTCNVTSVTI